MGTRNERIVYPCYFDAALPRSAGRRVALPAAVRDPSLADLERAARRAGLSFRAEQKHYPGRWWKQEGRLVVEWNGGKEELLRVIASQLAARR